MADLLSSLLDGAAPTQASVLPSIPTETSSSVSQTSVRSKSSATVTSDGGTSSSTESAQKTRTKASSTLSALASPGPVQSNSVTLTPVATTSSITSPSFLADQKSFQTSAPVTSTSSESTSTPSSTATPSSTETSSATSKPSITQPLPSTTFVTSVSSSIAPPSSSTSSFASIETAAATGNNPVSTTGSGANNGSKVPVAGIVVASVVGVMALVGIFFLIFRYCKPLRRRYEAWQEQKRLGRTYRSAIDDPEFKTEKLVSESSPQVGPYTGGRFYAQAPQTPTSRADHAQHTGLGLGSRLSLLRQHSPFQPAERGPQTAYGPSAPGAQYDRNLPPLPR